MSTHYGNGYKTQDEPTMKFLEKMQELNIPILDLHTSGHADYLALQEVINTTKPDVVIPIHTENKEKIKDYTDNAVILEDGEIYQVKEQINEQRKNKSSKSATKQTTNTRRNNGNL